MENPFKLVKPDWNLLDWVAVYLITCGIGFHGFLLLIFFR